MMKNYQNNENSTEKDITMKELFSEAGISEEQLKNEGFSDADLNETLSESEARLAKEEAEAMKTMKKLATWQKIMYILLSISIIITIIKAIVR